MAKLVRPLTGLFSTDTGLFHKEWPSLCAPLQASLAEIWVLLQRNQARLWRCRALLRATPGSESAQDDMENGKNVSVRLKHFQVIARRHEWDRGEGERESLRERKREGACVCVCVSRGMGC